jgi:undecaprenyl-diphosphatase
MPKRMRRQTFPERHSSDLINTIREFSIEFFVLIGILIISLIIICFLVEYIIPEKQNFIDNAAFHILQPLISPDHTRLVRFITFFGTGSFLIPSYMLMVFALIKRNYLRYAMMVSTMVLSSLLLGWLLKYMFHRSRPLFPLISGAGGYSFPSGHALGGFIFSGIVLFLVWKTKANYYLKWIISILTTSFGMLIGLSRIYLHAHYATDIIGSFLVTIAWFSLSYIFFRCLYKCEMHKRKPFPAKDSDLFYENFQIYN